MAILRYSRSWRTAICAFVLAVVESPAFSTGSWAACIDDPNTAQKATQFSDNPFPLLNGPNGPYSADASRMTELRRQAGSADSHSQRAKGLAEG